MFNVVEGKGGWRHNEAHGDDPKCLFPCTCQRSVGHYQGVGASLWSFLSNFFHYECNNKCLIIIPHIFFLPLIFFFFY